MQDLPLNHPKKFLMMGGIALALGCILAIAHVTERIAALHVEIWDRGLPLEVKAERSPIEDAQLASMRTILKDSNKAYKLLTTCLCVGVFSGFVIASWGYCAWSKEWESAKNRRERRQGDGEVTK